MNHKLFFIVTFVLIALIPSVSQATVTCNPRVVIGNHHGVGGTTHTMAYDSNIATFFKSTYNNWQFIQIDFNCVGEFSAIRRYMSRDGTDTMGHRGRQGEGVSYSLDGVNWIELNANTTSGWEIYVNIGARLHAWHSVVYGWSAWLKLITPVQARYVRFNWDGDLDAINEIEITFTEPILPLPRTQPSEHPWPMLNHDTSHHGFTDLTGPDDPTILEPWPFPADDWIQSAPVIGIDGTAYFGTNDGNFYAVYPTAPTTSGLEKWRFPGGNPILGAPALKVIHPEFKSLVYFATEAGNVYSLDTRNGSIVWDLDLNTPVRSSPVVVTPPNQLAWIYLRTADGVYAIQESGNPRSPTANLVWRSGYPDPGNRTSVTLSPDGAQVYAIAAEELFVLDAKTGVDIYKIKLSGTLTTPVVDPNGYVYVVGSNNSPEKSFLYSYALYQLGSNWVFQQRYALPFDEPITFTPALAPNGLIVFVSGMTLYAVDRFTGSLTCNACWQFDIPWLVGSPPVVDGSGTVYLAGKDGKVHAIRNSGQVWEVEANQIGKFTAPAIDGFGRLYIGSADKNLYVLQDDPAFKIAFESNLNKAPNIDVYTLRESYGVTDPRRTIRVTGELAYDGQPTYSIDGRWLAFVSDREGSQDVFLGTSGGLELHNLTQAGVGPFRAGSHETEPAFSPTDLDGQSRLGHGGHYLTLTSEIDDIKQLYFIDLEEFVRTGTVNAISLSNWLNQQIPGVSSTEDEHGQATFSPDGRKLAYSACTRTGGTHSNELILLDLNLGDRYTLVELKLPGDCDDDFPDFVPAFSPDSHYLVYHSDGNLKVIDITDLQLPEFPEFTIEPPDLQAHHPAWSPDGTEIVFTGINRVGEEGLYVAQGPRYQRIVSISDALTPRPPTVFDEAGYHPIQSPEPRVSSDCVIDSPAPLLLQPQAQQPRSTIEIRGCGFDIKFPHRNESFFRHARDRSRWVQADILQARVDVEQGLGVLEVTVPDLAGDGSVKVITPFGQATVSGFEVIPLPLMLVQPRSIPGAKIRILGYGFQIPDATNTRLNKVFFTGQDGTQSLAAMAEIAHQQPCGISLTPCPPRAPRFDGETQVEWLEVVVPEGVIPGNVRVTNDDYNEGDVTGPFGLLSPSLTLSRDTGCEGIPAEGISPVQVKFIGQEFPYDVYFHYTSAELLQKENQSEQRLGWATISPSASQDGAGEFVSAFVEVAPNDGGELTMVAEGRNSMARADHSLKTPLKNLPIIFVPGTSGTYITNKGGDFSHGFCLGMQAFDPGHSLKNDVSAGEDVWINAHGLLHVVAASCGDWLNPTKLDPLMALGDDGLPHDDFPQMDVGEVIREVQPPLGEPLKKAFGPLIDFITRSESQDGMDRPLGNPAANFWPPNGLYLFNLDWRKSFSSQAERLDNLVNEVLARTNKEKVVIITQSVGGPVTQFYLRSPQYNAADNVDQVISPGLQRIIAI